MVTSLWSRLGAEPHARCHWVWCPGCDSAHMLRSVLEGVDPGDEVVWGWDGDEEHPTFDPSYLCRGGPDDVCHSFIRAGRWEFLGDCTHELAGQTVDLPPLPDWLVH